MKYSPYLTCHQASRLITARLDRPLNPIERVCLRLHLSICSACPVVIRQLDMIHDGMHDWRNIA
jgi:hypothetical protein